MKRFILVPFFLCFFGIFSTACTGGGDSTWSGPHQAPDSQRNLLAAPAADVEAKVTFFYGIILDRAPDAGGLKFWSDEIRAGRQNLESLRAAFIFSEEFANIVYAMNDEAFLNYAYSKAFNRSPDPGGFDFWANQLKQGQDRRAVFYTFADSPEFRGLYPQLFEPIEVNVCVKPSGATTQVNLGWDQVIQQRMDSGTVAFIPVVAGRDGRSVVNFTQGQQPSTPPGVVTEIDVSQCPGVINTQSPCYQRTTFVNYNAIDIYTAPVPAMGVTDQQSLGGRGCWAPASAGAWYVNVRWTFSRCPFGSCGFSLQWSTGAW